MIAIRSALQTDKKPTTHTEEIEHWNTRATRQQSVA